MTTQKPSETTDSTTSRTPSNIKSSALLTIQAGVPSEDSQDWAKMLVRMYSQWGAHHDYKVRTLVISPGSQVTTIEISGDWAYGRLRSEIGVHRLIRVSPSDPDNRRRSCFANVTAVPNDGEPNELEEIEIKPHDKRIQWNRTIRSYVMDPYQRVMDHRTDRQTSDVKGVLDGNLDPFIEAYLDDTGSRIP